MYPTRYNKPLSHITLFNISKCNPATPCTGTPKARKPQPIKTKAFLLLLRATRQSTLRNKSYPCFSPHSHEDYTNTSGEGTYATMPPLDYVLDPAFLAQGRTLYEEQSVPILPGRLFFATAIMLWVLWFADTHNGTDSHPYRATWTAWTMMPGSHIQASGFEDAKGSLCSFTHDISPRAPEIGEPPLKSL
jgi:hypothetical protein